MPTGYENQSSAYLYKIVLFLNIIFSDFTDFTTLSRTVLAKKNKSFNASILLLGPYLALYPQASFHSEENERHSLEPEPMRVACAKMAYHIEVSGVESMIPEVRNT